MTKPIEPVQIEFDDLPPRAKEAIELSQTLFCAEDDNSTPMCHIYGHNQTKCAIDLTDYMDDGDKKSQFCTMLVLLCCNQNIEAFSVITESHVMSVEGDEGLEDAIQNPSSSPKEMIKRLRAAGYTPQLGECFTLIYEDRQYSYMGFCNIATLQESRARQMEEWHFLRMPQENIPTDGEFAPQMQGIFQKAASLVETLIKSEPEEDS